MCMYKSVKRVDLYSVNQCRNSIGSKTWFGLALPTGIGQSMYTLDMIRELSSNLNQIHIEI